MIHVIATAQVRDGQRKAFIELFKKLVPKVLAEAGCIAYGPTTDIENTGIGAQIPVRPNVVTIVEQWESLDALKAHLAAPHMQEWREQSIELVEKTTLQILEPA